MSEKQETIKNKPLLQKVFEFEKENVQIPKATKAYGYYYADLDSIIEILTPHLQEHGIGYTHTINQENQDTQARLRSILFNPDNPDETLTCENYIDENVKLQGMNKFMVIGSAITYFRRYHLVSMLGLTTEADTDAGGAEKQTKDNNTTSKPAAYKSGGKSIDNAKQESEVDYVKIFDNLISRDKTNEQLNKMFDKYKKNITTEDAKVIKEKINKSNKSE